jgi:hypothetical protein
MDPGFYAPVNQLLLRKAAEDAQAVADDFQEEASEAALAGNPARASYLEHMAMRVFRLPLSAP